MFSAIVLACAMGLNGEPNYNQCVTLSSQLVFPDFERCVEALGIGIMAIEKEGGVIVGVECYSWKAKKGTSL